MKVNVFPPPLSSPSVLILEVITLRWEHHEMENVWIPESLDEKAPLPN